MSPLSSKKFRHPPPLPPPLHVLRVFSLADKEIYIKNFGQVRELRTPDFQNLIQMSVCTADKTKMKIENPGRMVHEGKKFTKFFF